MKLFSLYKMGSNEPEYTKVTREEKKKKKRQHTRPRRKKKVTTPQTGEQLADENSHRYPGTEITRESPQDTQEGTTQLEDSPE